MSKKKCNFGLLILGIALQWTLAGCSSQMETTILSEKAPPEPEVTEVQEEPVAPPEPLVRESKIIEQDLETPPREVPPPVAMAPSGMAVATPGKAREAEKSIVSSPSAGPVVGGIPPIMFDPELPPQPNMRKGAPEEVAMLEPETIKVPEGETVVPPALREPSFPPVMAEPELPPDPTESELVQEKSIEVAKVQPGAPVMPIKTLADVYFDYDRFSLREDDKNKLNTNAQILVEQLSGQKVIIEGHCDERGTASYNMILGKRRAETVRQFLVDLGVPKENLEVVSYGKERPFCTDHSLQCWQQNRRGHFVVR